MLEDASIAPDVANPLADASVTSSRPVTCEHVSAGPWATVLADIYRDEINLAVWQRTPQPEIALTVQDLVRRSQLVQLSLAVSPSTAQLSISKALNVDTHDALCEDIVELVDMFSELFDCAQLGLRFTTLDRAMCPRFHVDRLGCRLITTYTGAATEWLPHERVDRSRLGMASAGLADHASGVYASEQHVQRLEPGDVALLKGEGWEGNEGRGIVHRSPAIPAGEKRLLLTLDSL